MGEVVLLEVDRHEGKTGGRGDACIGEEISLPLLGRGMIDLEDTQAGV